MTIAFMSGMADRIMARSGTGYQEFEFVKKVHRPMGFPLSALLGCISKVSWVISHLEKFIFVMHNQVNILYV